MDNDFCSPWENPNILKDLDLNKPSDASKSLRYLFKFWPSTNELINCKFPHFVSLYPAIDCKFPLINYNDLHEVQCVNCGAFLDYLAKIDKEKREWTCPFCSNANRIDDDEYVQFLSRRELHNSYYEMKIRNNTGINVSTSKNFLFIIDVSYPAVACGMTDEFIKQIRTIITTTTPNYNIAILTMSDKITIYDLTTSEKIENTDFSNQNLPYQTIFQPIMSCMQRVDDILNEIQEYVPDDSINGHCLLNAVIQAGNIIGQNGGMIFVGFTGLSTFGPLSRVGPYDFDIEQSAQITKDDPLTKKSIEIGLAFKTMNISVHLFAGGTNFCDLMVVGHVSSATNGRVYYYGSLNENSKRSFTNDILSTVKQPYLCNCSLNINVSEGLQFVQKDDPMALAVSSKKDVRFPIMRPNDFCRVRLQNVRKVDHCYIQLSMIYTKYPSTRSNERQGENENRENREENDQTDNDNDNNNEDNDNDNDAAVPHQMLRVITHVLPVTDDKEKLYRSLNEESLIKMMTVYMLTNVMRFGKSQAEVGIFNELLSMYPNIPRSIFHLTHSLLSNSNFLKGPKSEIDKKSAGFINIFFFDELTILLYLYPRLILVQSSNEEKKSIFKLFHRFSLFKDNHNYDDDDTEEQLIENINNNTNFVIENKKVISKTMYKTLPLARESLNDGTVFIIHKHDSVFIFIRKNVSPSYLTKAFGVKNLRDVQNDVPVLKTNENKLIWSIYNECCMLSKIILPFETIIEGNRTELLNDLFVDDKLVSYSSLSSWIAQFDFQASLFTCI